MKILVCISNVPDTTSKINFTEDNTKFDTTGVQFVINPNDEFGLTRAMWFKEKQGATVHVATVGGPGVEPTMRKALAIGADEGIRINAEPTDGFFVAQHLAEVIKNGGICLSPRGELMTEANIQGRLTMRNFLEELRSSDVQTGGPPPFSQRDRQNFANELDRYLRENG